MFWSYLLSILLLGCGFLLMFVVLLQRGRGGGLAGAFGGMGGQSALGTRAGDVFTKITVILATIWVVLAGVTGLAMQKEQTGRFKGGSAAVSEEPGVEAAGEAGEGEGAAAEGDAGEGGPALGSPTAPATGETPETPATGEAPATGDTPAEGAATPAADDKPAEGDSPAP